VALLAIGDQVTPVWSDGLAQHVVLYIIRRCTGGDTIDLSTDFDPPMRGALVGVTLNGVAQATFDNAGVVTLPPGPNRDVAYLLVYGIHK
jgi:hypothetical protein